MEREWSWVRSGAADCAATFLATVAVLACAGCGGGDAGDGGGEPPPSPQVTLSATPASLASGSSATLDWSSTDATACTASGGWSGSRPTSGSESTGPLGTTTTYTLTCTGSGGSASDSAVVTVNGSPPAPAVSLSASPTGVSSGGAATLTWSSDDATACSASGGWSGSRPTSGSESTGPLNSTTTYSLECSGAGGTATASVTVTVSSAGTIYGLEWPGDGAVRRMLYWRNPFPIYDATYVFRVYPRRKAVPPFPNGYYTTFFWGNDGTFTWDNGGANTYYGAHPYPIPAPNGPGQWEISVYGNDYVTGSEVAWNRWYTQVFRAWRESPSVTHHEFYWDLPDTSRVIRRTIDDVNWAKLNPPAPAIVVGQAPDNGTGVSWGGYVGWEEFNGIIRGIQIYSGLLSLEEVQSEIAAPLSTVGGRSKIWYLNLNPRPNDVTDKKGIGTPHDPSWAGTTALEWTG